MTKIKFILALHDKLSHLPQSEVEERLNFYSEMIEDRMEDGLSEEEAVLAVGEVDEIAEQIISEIFPSKTTNEKPSEKRKLKAWEIVLLSIGAPVWLPIIIAAVAVIISLYASVWAVTVSLWAVFISLVGCVLGGTVSGIGFILTGYTLSGIAVAGASIFLCGLCIFTFCGCKGVTKGIVLLTKKTALSVKGHFSKKEEA